MLDNVSMPKKEAEIKPSIEDNVIHIDYDYLKRIYGECPNVFVAPEDTQLDDIDRKKQARNLFIRVNQYNRIHKDNPTLGLKAGDIVKFSDDIVEQLVKDIAKTKAGLKYYIIRHSHIDAETGEETGVHWHIVLDADNNSKMYWHRLKEWFPFGEIKPCEHGVRACVRYMTHLYDPTKDTTYDWSDIVTNAPSRIDEYKQCTISPAKYNYVDKILDDIGKGNVSLSDVTKLLTASQYAKHKKKLMLAEEYYFKNASEKFYQQMQEEGRLVCVYWLYGETESGKSFVAEKLAREKGSFYKTTCQKDSFQMYQLEPQILLDDLRPNTIPYSELLALFNPFSGGRVLMSSRFFNKALSYDTVFITSPYDPLSFYKEYHLSSIDKQEQLLRRIATVVKFDKDYLYEMKYVDGNYVEVSKKPNPYSKENQKEYELNNIFDKL